jgi:dipeptidyl aminopeptidase/acylaminoacyl peptidase
VALAQAQQGKRAITHEDVWLMRQIGQPVVNADGKLAVVSVRVPAYAQENDASDLWMLTTDGTTEPRRLTATKAEETGVEWSPDGHRIAFSSRREGDLAPQIYVLDLIGGGDAERLTQLTGGARSPHWSPDGRQLAFLSDVYSQDNDSGKEGVLPEGGALGAKANVRIYDSMPVHDLDGWLDASRAHLFVQEASTGAVARDLFAGTRFSSQPGTGGVSRGGVEDIPLTWTPDGKGILFVAATERNRLSYPFVDTQLHLIKVNGGEPERLTNGPGEFGRPVFMPGGEFLVVAVRERGSQQGFAMQRLARYPWPFDPARRTWLTADLDREAGAPVVSPDGQRVYFTVEDAGLQKLYSGSLAEGKTRLEYEPSAGLLNHLAGAGTGDAFRLLAVWEAASRPPEVFAFTPGQTKPKALSHFNTARAAALDLFPVEHFWIRGVHGSSVHSLVVRPAGFDPTRRYPVVVLLHDGPHEMAGDSFARSWNYHLLAGSEYVVVVTNYAGSTGFGAAFAGSGGTDPIATAAGEIGAVLDAVLQHFSFVDRSRVAAVGVGYGGAIVERFEEDPGRFRSLVAHAASISPVLREKRARTVEGTPGAEIAGGAGPVEGAVTVPGGGVEPSNTSAGRAPMMISVAEGDFRVSMAETLATWDRLKRSGVAGRLLVFPAEKQELQSGENSRFLQAEIRRWLARWFAAEPGAGTAGVATPATE